MTKTLTVWITRTRPGAEETAGRVRAAGFTPLIAPLLTVVAESDVKVGQGDLAFTSRNGVRLYDGDTARTAWCVGEATAREAQDKGFTDIRIGPGTVAGLTALMASGLTRPVTHYAGAHIRGDLVGELTRAGHTATRTIAYRAHPVTAPPVTFADIVMFHSPRAAQTYIDIAKDRASISVSISPAADAPLGADSPLMRYIAGAPTEDAMIRALQRAAAGRKGTP